MPLLTTEAPIVATGQEHKNCIDSGVAVLAEGDAGLLTFQGTRYLGFERRGSKAAYYDRPENGEERQRASWDPER